MVKWSIGITVSADEIGYLAGIRNGRQKFGSVAIENAHPYMVWH
jgi:hypothetical protein